MKAVKIMKKVMAFTLSMSMLVGDLQLVKASEIVAEDTRVVETVPEEQLETVLPEETETEVSEAADHSETTEVSDKTEQSETTEASEGTETTEETEALGQSETEEISQNTEVVEESEAVGEDAVANRVMPEESIEVSEEAAIISEVESASADAYEVSADYGVVSFEEAAALTENMYQASWNYAYYYLKVEFYNADTEELLATAADGKYLQFAGWAYQNKTVNFSFNANSDYKLDKITLQNNWANEGTLSADGNGRYSCSLSAYNQYVGNYKTLMIYVTTKETMSGQVVYNTDLTSSYGNVSLAEITGLGDHVALTAKNKELVEKLSGLTTSMNYGHVNSYYQFSHVLVGDVTASYIKAADGKYYYTREKTITENTEWSEVGEKTVKFVYETKVNSTVIETVDTRDKIKLNLYNYTLTKGNSINSGHAFKFYLNPAQGTGMNNWTGNPATVNPDIVKNLLGEDGYPVLKGNGEESLAYLFNNEAATGKVGIYENASYLFAYDAESGYYSFDSADENAVLNKNTMDFMVYENADGNFFPFGIASDTDKFSLGLNMGFDFIQPYAGTISEEPMKFEFSGDDDVWIFIDGVLVLDLGGIHGEVNGNINFATGVVEGDRIVASNDTTSTTLYDAYKNSEKYTEEQLAVIFDITYNEDGTVESARYTDYSKHHLEMFYLERGANISNCKMKFNMPTIPQEAISVTKKVVSADENASLDEESYRFQLFMGDSAENCSLVTDMVYDVYQNGRDTGVDGNIGAEGIFTLKNGETAVFNNIEKGTCYYVKELNPGKDYSVSVDGTILEADTDGNYITDISDVDEESGILIVNIKKLVETEDEKALDKTVSLLDWEDRTYNIELTANMKTIITETIVTETVSPVDVAFVFDASGSMLFPGDLVEATDENGKQLTKTSQLDKNNIYYYVGTTASATVYRVYYSNRKWRYVDASYENGSNDPEVAFSPDSGFYISKEGVNRLTKLQEAACTLVDRLPEGSTVGLVTFNSSASKVMDAVTLNEETRNELKNTINAITTSGGTRQDLGLNKAMEITRKFTNESKYVVFLTDGCPNGDGDIVGAAKKKADAIKAQDVKIFSIGIDLDLNSYMNTAKELMYYAASGETEAEKSEFYKNIRASELNDVFEALGNTITNTTVTTKETAKVARVKDYIDDRFEIVDKSQIEALGGMVGTDENGTYILWGAIDGITLDNWKSGTFTVRAKENYVGGNDVTTNGSLSGVYEINGELYEKFEQPKVNVRVECSLLPESDTIFLGEELTNYFTAGKQENMKNVVSAYNKGEAALILDDVTIGEMSWYTDKECKNEITAEELAVQKPEKETVYYGKLSIEPKTDGSEGTKNTIQNGEEKQVEKSYLETDYTVSIVTGSLTITKKISKFAYQAVEGDPIFTFRITNETTGDVFYKTLRFNENSSVDTSDDMQIEEGWFNITCSATIEELPQGIYRVEELETMGFVVKDIKTLEAACADRIVDKLYAQYAIGFDMDVEGNSFDEPKGLQSGPQDFHLEKKSANVRFANSKSRDDGKLTHTDAVKNSFVFGEAIEKENLVDNEATAKY